MTTTRLTMAWESAELPADVAGFLEEADARIDRFLEQTVEKPIVGFVPSDYEQVYRVLRSVVEQDLATGRNFCEWGSGFGVVASLAAMLDFRSYGIEIEHRLVREARSLASDYGLTVEFGQGSLVPPDGEHIAERTEELAFLSLGGRCGHDDLDILPDDMDVIFAYPWPGEEDIMRDLFDYFAAVGALLVTYHGDEGVVLWRKTGPGGSRRT